MQFDLLRIYEKYVKINQMKLSWSVAISLFCLLMASFNFMVGAFVGGGLANKGNLTKGFTTFLNLSVFIMPILCVISGVIVITAYYFEQKSGYYWVGLVPVCTIIAYFIGIAILK